MKVLVLSDMFPNPGNPSSGIFVLEQARALRSQGVECLVVSPTPWVPPPLKWLPRWKKLASTPPQDTVQGFRVEYPRVPELPRGWLFGLYGVIYFLFCYGLVKRLVRQESIDLIHAHTIMPDGFAAVLLGRRLQLPVVCTVHGSDVNIYPFRSRLSLWATSWALKRVDCLIGVSLHLKGRIASLVGNRRCEVIYNGTHPDLFVPMQRSRARALLRLPMGKKLVLFVGNLSPVKGVEFLLDAFSRLSGTDHLLYVVGEGVLKESLISLAVRLRISDRVKFAGRRPHDEIPLWLSAADCLVLPSLSEGFPTILPEAMACRLPVVATEVGGVPEIVRHGESGLLVPARDPEALMSAVVTMLRGDGNVCAMVERAETMARANFTWGINAQKTLVLYHETRLTQLGSRLPPEAERGHR